MRHGEVGLEPERLVVLLDGRLRLAQLLEREAEVVGRPGEIRLQPQRRPAAVDGVLKVAQHPVGFGEVGVVGGGMRIQRDRAADEPDGTPGVPLLQRHHAQQMMRIGVPGIAGDHNLVDPRRLGQVALLVMLKGRVQGVFHGACVPFGLRLSALGQGANNRRRNGDDGCSARWVAGRCKRSRRAGGIGRTPPLGRRPRGAEGVVSQARRQSRPMSAQQGGILTGGRIDGKKSTRSSSRGVEIPRLETTRIEASFRAREAVRS